MTKENATLVLIILNTTVQGELRTNQELDWHDLRI